MKLYTKSNLYKTNIILYLILAITSFSSEHAIIQNAISALFFIYVLVNIYILHLIKQKSIPAEILKSDLEIFTLSIMLFTISTYYNFK
jgi:hypothetical protein